MALNNISELSTTAASNTDFAGTSILGTGLVSTADDSFRNLASFEAKWWNDIGAVNTVAGTGDAVTVTTLTLYTAHKTGMMFRFVAGAANTGPATLNLDSIGAKAIRKISGGTDVALAAGDLAAGETYTVIYRASANSAAGAWVLVGLSAGITFATRTEANTGTSTTKAVPPAYLYFPTGHLWGLTLSNNAGDATNDIDIAVGTVRDSTDTVNMIFATAMGKRLDANWAVGGTTGTTLGGRYSGAAITDTTYHVWAVCKADGANPDIYFDPSAVPATVLGHLQAETGGASYLYVRRIGSIVRASAAILAFSQNGDEFILNADVLDVNASNPGTSAVTRTLTVPTGIKVVALFNALLKNGASAVFPTGFFSPLDQSDQAPSASAAPLSNLGGNVAAAAGGTNNAAGIFAIRTNTSAQIRSRLSASDASVTLLVATYGWIDTRGQQN